MGLEIPIRNRFEQPTPCLQVNQMNSNRSLWNLYADMMFPITCSYSQVPLGKGLFFLGFLGQMIGPVLAKITLSLSVSKATQPTMVSQSSMTPKYTPASSAFGTDRGSPWSRGFKELAPASHNVSPILLTLFTQVLATRAISTSPYGPWRELCLTIV